jgi:sugar/nucleoside kinase (ribokinase family)
MWLLRRVRPFSKSPPIILSMGPMKSKTFESARAAGTQGGHRWVDRDVKRPRGIVRLVGRTSSTPELVVVGCPSMDRLMGPEGAVGAPGGAGFNTALAARIGGVDVGLVAAIPTHLPREIGAAFGPGGIRRAGLVVRDGAIASFHITYDDQQDAEYLAAEVSIELTLGPHDVPDPWLAARHLHIGPLGASSRRQLEFAEGIRERGFTGSLSVGSFHADLDEDRDAARALAAIADIVFLNAAESADLFPDGPPPTPTFVVTRGRRGATVHHGGSAVDHPAEAVTVVDPTGAGDAFCGGYLAGWLRGLDPIASAGMAARTALSGYGSTELVARVAASVGPRVRRDPEQIARVAAMLAAEATEASLDFCGFPFPERGTPWAVEMFAMATLHQYGFWNSNVEGWTEPMYGIAGGRSFKGSDYLWQAFTRAATEDPSVLDPIRAASEPLLFDAICADDSGSCPVPFVESHRALQQRYGEALIAVGGFGAILAEANRADRPAAALLERLTSLPGYAEDPLAKKANLLAIILANRPERFLDLRDPASITPIVDYHLMRSCLRTGCVEILDDDLRRRVEGRGWVDEAEEEEIRAACFDAIESLVERSGLTQAAVDGFFFTNARKVCVEVEDPRCDECAAEHACAQRTALFQPVIRTTAY